ncbi:isoamyl alcohol oxidase, putative [Cordyceps militaris CM01]|uniref:Isoamyl alcohol oxidase, putative n=1 Tax=Cordyceps militaris (strain CM01) TaxID=983644 RepID=G3JET0_CORMM|nr:isoamyl alcohol oxidase, putative [Cordyceps militaris CM01]EGX93039.1 isoamyl alcohol oxidase, putative [Cordyceps militaris CM01]
MVSPIPDQQLGCSKDRLHINLLISSHLTINSQLINIESLVVYHLHSTPFYFCDGDSPEMVNFSFTVALLFSTVSWASTQAVPEPAAVQNVPSAAHCRNIPGDAAWPPAQAWSRLNSTVNGGLMATVPLGSVCHDPDYDAAKCRALADGWGLAQLVYAFRPKNEFMSLYFQNNTCTPFSPRSAKCDLGNYVSYSIDVRSVDDVRAGLEFVQRHNIRLVIKNSGHDFNGQSTGKGALALWMHNYNKTRLIKEFASSYYNGPALEVQTGAEGGVAAAYANDHGYTVVSGACPTIKMAGGYLAGGGHGYLNGVYGFAADNVLAWDVVLADGSRVVATPTRHRDLYWALSGGGGGAFGVVLSATVRVFRNEVAANAAFSFSAAQAGGAAPYWRSVAAFQQQLTPLLDHGAVAEYQLSDGGLVVSGIMVPGQTSDALRALLRPLVRGLERASGLRLTEAALAIKYAQADSYYALYREQILPRLGDLVLPATLAGRLVPRTAMDQNPASVHRALRDIAGRGYSLVVIALNAVSAVRNQTAPPIAPNAVQPNFVHAHSSFMINPGWSNALPWSEAQVLQDELVNEILPLYDAAVPDAGVYKNEANWAEKDLKNSLYAGTYQRLEKIKKEVDPAGLFYGIVSVGFDQFQLDGSGRLCKK